MLDQKTKAEAELIRLETLSNQGVNLTICGKDVTMKALPFERAQRIGMQIHKEIKEKVDESASPIDQGKVLADRLGDLLIEVFTVDGRQQITREDLPKMTDIDLRKIKVAFTLLNELSVQILGELLAPVFPYLKSGFTGVLSTMLPGSSESSLSSTPSPSDTDGR